MPRTSHILRHRFIMGQQKHSNSAKAPTGYGLIALRTPPVTKESNFKTTGWGGFSFRDALNVMNRCIERTGDPTCNELYYGGYYILGTYHGFCMLNYQVIHTAVDSMIGLEALRLFSYITRIMDKVTPSRPFLLTAMSADAHLLPPPISPKNQSNGCIVALPAGTQFDGLPELDNWLMISWSWIYGGVPTSDVVKQQYVGAVEIVNHMLLSAQMNYRIKRHIGSVAKATPEKKEQWRTAYSAYSLDNKKFPLIYGSGYQLPADTHIMHEYVLSHHDEPAS